MADFWKTGVVYQVYPRSFADSDGDGMGDIPGITAHLDHIAQLGANIIWLSPVYVSPDCDNGYDIADYKNINPKFGTLADMDELIARANERGIRIVMDLVVNHTSDRHEWFVASRDKDSPYRDYYIWRPGKNGGPPNNWTSFFGGPAWDYDEKSGEYYLHLFDKGQPDLNYYNPAVIGQVKDILRFWLDRGVSGFRCDVINILYKTSLADGKKRVALTGREYYLSQQGTLDILRSFKQDVLSGYDCYTVGETVMVDCEQARRLCSPDGGALDMLFCFEHMEVDCIGVKWFHRPFSPARFGQVISRWQQGVDWNANYLENHDQPRCVSRLCPDPAMREQAAKMLGLMLLSLRGTPYIYQGQELGMTNFDFTGMSDIQDVESKNIYQIAKKLGIPKGYRWKMICRASRDNARTPMQWSAAPGAGFTTPQATPWLGINKNHSYINAEAERDDPDSVFSFYRRMIALRAGSETLLSGSFEPVNTRGSVFAYRRTGDGEKLTVLLNFSSRPRKFAQGGRVLISSAGRESYDGVLMPWEGVLMKEEAAD